MYGQEILLAVLWWLWHMPWLSVAETEIVTGLRSSPAQRLIEDGLNQGLMKENKLGGSRPAMARFSLTRPGIQYVREQCDLLLEWQATERGLEELKGLFRFVDATYHVVIRFFQSNAALLPSTLPIDPSDDPELIHLNEKTRLMQFHWLRTRKRGFRPHALAHYLSEDSHTVTLPTYLYGYPHRARKPLPGLPGLYGDLPTTPSLWYGSKAASPLGPLVLAIDPFAAHCAQTELVLDLPSAIITTDMEVYRQLDPVLPFGKVAVAGNKARTIGWPETVIERDAVAAALNGSTNRKIHEFIENFPAALRNQVAVEVGRGRDEVKSVVDSWLKEDLNIFQNFDNQRPLYLGRVGNDASKKRERLDESDFPSDHSTYLKPDGKYRRQQEGHNRALVEIHLRCGELGIFSVQGRRRIINLPEANTRVAPDLYVRLPLGYGKFLWVALEFERSATSTDSMENKRRGYLALRERSRLLRVLLITDKDTQGRMTAQERADRLEAMFGDFPILTTTLAQFLSGPSFGPESVWRSKGQKVSLDYLSVVGEEEPYEDEFQQSSGLDSIWRPGGAELSHDHLNRLRVLDPSESEFVQSDSGPLTFLK